MAFSSELDMAAITKRIPCPPSSFNSRRAVFGFVPVSLVVRLTLREEPISFRKSFTSSAAMPRAIFDMAPCEDQSPVMGSSAPIRISCPSESAQYPALAVALKQAKQHRIN